MKKFVEFIKGLFGKLLERLFRKNKVTAADATVYDNDGDKSEKADYSDTWTETGYCVECKGNCSSYDSCKSSDSEEVKEENTSSESMPSTDAEEYEYFDEDDFYDEEEQEHGSLLRLAADILISLGCVIGVVVAVVKAIKKFRRK